MYGITNVDIIYENDGVGNPNSSIKGKVIIELLNSLQNPTLIIECICQYSLKGIRRSLLPLRRKGLILMRKCLNLSDYLNISSRSYKIPFQFRLPRDAPESIEIKAFSTIRYFCQINLIPSKGINESITIRRCFSVVKTLDSASVNLKTFPTYLKHSLEVTGTRFLVHEKNESLTLALDLDKIIFVPGEDIRIRANIINNCRFRIQRAFISLMQVVLTEKEAMKLQSRGINICDPFRGIKKTFKDGGLENPNFELSSSDVTNYGLPNQSKIFPKVNCYADCLCDPGLSLFCLNCCPKSFKRKSQLEKDEDIISMVSASSKINSLSPKTQRELFNMCRVKSRLNPPKSVETCNYSTNWTGLHMGRVKINDEGLWKPSHINTVNSKELHRLESFTKLETPIKTVLHIPPVPCSTYPSVSQPNKNDQLSENDLSEFNTVVVYRLLLSAHIERYRISDSFAVQLEMPILIATKPLNDINAKDRVFTMTYAETTTGEAVLDTFRKDANEPKNPLANIYKCNHSNSVKSMQTITNPKRNGMNMFMANSRNSESIYIPKYFYYRIRDSQKTTEPDKVIFHQSVKQNTSVEKKKKSILKKPKQETEKKQKKETDRAPKLSHRKDTNV